MAASSNRPANHLYYGDNLDVLRREIADGSVDLVYLDPPFNSNANYNILFKSPTGAAADAQVEVFGDTWKWTDASEIAFDEVRYSGNLRAFELLRAMRTFLGDNDMMAYLSMMAIRMIEIHRKLKETGSVFLHCDPTASHYLKLLLDAVFGARRYRNEIIWCYTGPGSPGMRQFMRKHDVIFWFNKGDSWTFNGDAVRVAHSPKTRENYKPGLTGSGFVGADHVIHERGKIPEDYWTYAIAPRGREYLGYPTQKPVALLERIIAASSNEGDVVLDPFCGCGTAVHAAQKLGRQWIGIDVTHLAISLIEKRMQAAFPGVAFTVEGTPKDLESAMDLARRDKYQFQWWAVSMVDAMPYGGRKKGADGGVDGIIYFKPDGKRTERAIVSVKGGDNVGVGMIRDLHSAMEREKAPAGIFLCKATPTGAMEKEAAAVGRFAAAATGKTYPRLQIITLAELFRGKTPDLPLVDPTAAFRRAAREDTARQASLF
ncbi:MULTISPECIES: DNA methyltransferase [Sphingomonas]|uniref:Methyltransferase n=1 Tax=Sphingomonas adhaesiva TaxID=28212 RepID=A0A2A4I6J1_9SPHN|nr:MULTISPECIES: DNA methyltransferase [Sphingomonas]PCG14105.1 site-specific DNA-methyltransferase [Sphingomonas adhaesiva]PZU82112.1 MAG: site-specific DNA-methyltransferase [Sphingomonas sp.]